MPYTNYSADCTFAQESETCAGVNAEHLFKAIDRLLNEKSRAAIAIDGPCCAGKSTLAGLLASRYDGAVVPMDDFFLPPELRTKERLIKPGGNVHYERFLMEAAPGLRERKSFRYCPFDCAIMEMKAAVQVPDAKLYLIEGSYSMRPELIGLYDLCVFMDISEDKQKKRLSLRESEEQVLRFLTEWIPMENRYFDEFSIRERADIILFLN